MDGMDGFDEDPTTMLVMEELEWEALCQLLAKIGMVSSPEILQT